MAIVVSFVFAGDCGRNYIV